MKLKTKLQKIHFIIIWDGKKRAKYLKKNNILAQIGENCLFQSRIFPMDPKLVKLHNNVIVAANVYFVTHDAIRHMLSYKNKKKYQMYLGPIEVMDNVFIGLGSIILPNVKIGSNVIIAAGSLVTKDVPDNCIYGGIPAKKIGDFKDLEKNREIYSKNYSNLSYEQLVSLLWSEFNNKSQKEG